MKTIENERGWTGRQTVPTDCLPGHDLTRILNKPRWKSVEYYGRNTASVVPLRVAVPSSAWVTLNLSLSLSLSPPPFSIPSYFARSIYSIYNTFTRYVILYYAQKRICIDIFTWNKRRSLCDIFNSSFILVCHLRIVLLNLIKSQSCGRVEIKPISNSSTKTETYSLEIYK